jgi:hypothetical protein
MLENPTINDSFADKVDEPQPEPNLICIID